MLGVGAMSYAGAFNIMAVADRDTFPDVEVFAESARHEVRVLALATEVSSGRLLSSRPTTRAVRA